MIPVSKRARIFRALEGIPLEGMKINIEDFARRPHGWFVLDVMREKWPQWNWVVVMTDIDPNELNSYIADKAASRVFRIPGKHRNRDIAWNALDDLMQTRD